MSELKAFRLTVEQVERIDAWRASRRPIPSQSKAVRVILDEGLDAIERKDKERKER